MGFTMVQKDKFLSPSYPSVIDVSIVILGVVLLFGCSQIAIPIQPVPITLQTMGVIFIILTYNTSQAIQTILAYILLGALGIPLFSGYRGGLTVVIGPTGG